MILKGIFLLFVSAALFRTFGKLATSKRFHSSPKIKSEIRTEVRNEDISSSNLAFDHVASEKQLLSGPSKIAKNEIVISAKFKLRNPEITEEDESAPISEKFNEGNQKVRPKTGKDKVQIESAVKSVREMDAIHKKETPRKVESPKSIDSTARVSSSKSQKISVKTGPKQETDAKNGLHVSAKLRSTKKIGKHRSYQVRSGSFGLSVTSTKTLKPIRSVRRPLKILKNKGRTIHSASRMISQKGKLSSGKSTMGFKQTLGVRLKSAKRTDRKKKSVDKKEINRAVRTVTTATMPIQKATMLAGRTVRTYADDDDLRHQKLHYEYTSEYPASCPCAIAKGMYSGECWYFLDSSKTSCKKRTCSKSYVCVVGETTGLTCMRKDNTHRIVSNGDGSCRSEEFKSCQYIPYSA